MKAKVALIIALIVLAIFSIVVFALTISIFVNLKNKQELATKVPLTDAPTTGAVTTAPTSTGAATTVPPTTGPTTAAPTTGPITVPTTVPNTPTTAGPTSTQNPTSTAPPPTITTGTSTLVPTTTIPHGLYSFVSGQLTDDNRPWMQTYADPWSSDYNKLTQDYSNSIWNALVNSSKTYRTSQVTVTGFSGQYTDMNTTKPRTRVRFLIGVDNGASDFDVGTDLEAGARNLNFAWRNIVTTNSSSLPPLPEADQSPGWKSAANMFLNSINASVDPCQNFYSYACDNYIAKHPLGNAPRQSTFDVLQNQVYANLSVILGSANVTALNSETLKSVVQMYKACLRNDTYNTEHVTAIADKYGGWPLMNSSWTPSSLPDLYYFIGNIFTQYGVATLFTPSVDINWANVTANQVLFLDQANLAIPADYYRSPNLTQRYQDVLRTTIYQTLQTLSPGQVINNETVLPQIDQMVAIEVYLASISVNSSMLRNESLQFNPYRIQQAESQFININWRSFFNGSLFPVFPGEDPTKLVDPFILVEPNQYVKSLDAYLAEVNTNKDKYRDMVNYLIFRLISPFMRFSGPESSHIMEELRRQTRLDIPDITDQQSQCVSDLVNMIPWGAGRLYIDGFFPAQNRDDVSVMINNVLSAFSSTLSGLHWMDNVSALKAFNKVAGLVRNVAYPDFEQSDKDLDKFYDWWIQRTKNLNPNKYYAYYNYYMPTTQLQGQLIWQDLKIPGDRSDFLMSPAIVNAWYQPERNSITFPAAILNEPFYRYDFPQAVNYGGLGVVMGHELSHGFDDQGVQYDYDGTLHTWMTPQAQEGFDKMAQCVVDEYSSFCYPQACINGIATQGENIGDNGGLKAAFRAYQAYKAAHGDEKPLPGMETFSTDQIFFLSFAQVWCGSYSEDALTRQLLTNPHSPGKDRVIGAIQNFPKFGEAFKCKKGDPMYPVSHCDVW